MRTVITCRDVSSAQPLVVNSGNKHTPMFAFPGRKNMLSPTEINVQWEQTVSSWQNDLSVRTRRFLFFSESSLQSLYHIDRSPYFQVRTDSGYCIIIFH